MRDIKSLSGSPAAHQEPGRTPARCHQDTKKSFLEDSWRSCSTAQCVSKPLALETQQRARDTLHHTREVLVSSGSQGNLECFLVSMLIAGGLELQM